MDLLRLSLLKVARGSYSISKGPRLLRMPSSWFALATGVFRDMVDAAAVAFVSKVYFELRLSMRGRQMHSHKPTLKTALFPFSDCGPRVGEPGSAFPSAHCWQNLRRFKT